MEMPLYAKVGKPWRCHYMLRWESLFEEIRFYLFMKQARVGAEQTSSGKLFQTVAASKTRLWSKRFFYLCTDG